MDPKKGRGKGKKGRNGVWEEWEGKGGRIKKGGEGKSRGGEGVQF